VATLSRLHITISKKMLTSFAIFSRRNVKACTTLEGGYHRTQVNSLYRGEGVGEIKKIT
jgi:hypothetical protein